MKHLFIIFSLIFIFSCGKDTFPKTYNVPAKYYNEYKSSFDQVSEDIVSRTGIKIVKFVPRNEDPKYYKAEETFQNGEVWVYFKDDANHFVEVTDEMAGFAQKGSNYNPSKTIVLNFNGTPKWTNHKLRQVLNLEVLHTLGFEKTKDYSVMNPPINTLVTGLTALDLKRLAEKYPLPSHRPNGAHLENLKNITPESEQAKIRKNLLENYNFSEKRASAVAQDIMVLQKLQSENGGENSTSYTEAMERLKETLQAPSTDGNTAERNKELVQEMMMEK